MRRRIVAHRASGGARRAGRDRPCGTACARERRRSTKTSSGCGVTPTTTSSPACVREAEAGLAPVAARHLDLDLGRAGQRRCASIDAAPAPRPERVQLRDRRLHEPQPRRGAAAAPAARGTDCAPRQDDGGLLVGVQPVADPAHPDAAAVGRRDVRERQAWRRSPCRSPPRASGVGGLSFDEARAVERAHEVLPARAAGDAARVDVDVEHPAGRPPDRRRRAARRDRGTPTRRRWRPAGPKSLRASQRLRSRDPKKRTLC